MALKYSKQRECIKNYLLNSFDHPTADDIYMNVRKELPNISLGTVYRNLNLLADMGDILKINVSEHGQRFDGHTTPHNHFVCTECGCVNDLAPISIDDIHCLNNDPFKGEIESHSTLFLGKCEKCIQLKQ